jgi:hypothetical protein
MATGFRLSIDDVYRLFHPRFARSRMESFSAEFEPTAATRILDVGGTALNWGLVDCPAHITLLNLDPIHDPDLPPNLTYVQGDARALPFEQGAFDIAFSNSLIEHLGTFEDQRRFAAKLREIADGLWVQTPARSFPLEAHFLTPFVHFLPKRWQRRLARRFTLWGLLARPNPERIDALLGGLRLLSLAEMRALFPDCEIRRERFLGITKAYLAVRRRAR